MKLLELLKNTKYKTCPYCKKQIRKNAVRCKWCGRWVFKKQLKE
jgi:DNA-directed RNA polymerase subunit RPC12/RpoP